MHNNVPDSLCGWGTLVASLSLIPLNYKGGWERAVQWDEGDKYFPVGKKSCFLVFRLECLRHFSFFIHGERQCPIMFSEEK